MNDLRKAAEMALETLETTWGNGSEGTLKQWEETIQALRQALNVDAVNMSQKSVDETAKGEHEPVAWVGFDKDGDRCIAFEQKTLHEDDYPITSPLYIAPPKREWVGLTDEEVDEIYMHEGHEDVVLLTQAKLREKNT